MYLFSLAGAEHAVIERPPMSLAQVRGSTTHYEAVANAAAGGLLGAGQDSGVPVIFGVLTTETMEQVNSLMPFFKTPVYKLRTSLLLRQ